MTALKDQRALRYVNLPPTQGSHNMIVQQLPGLLGVLPLHGFVNLAMLVQSKCPDVFRCAVFALDFREKRSHDQGTKVIRYYQD